MQRVGLASEISLVILGQSRPFLFSVSLSFPPSSCALGRGCSSALLPVVAAERISVLGGAVSSLYR